jgi:hypothetical protein
MRFFSVSVGYNVIAINNLVEELPVKTSKKVKDKVLTHTFSCIIDLYNESRAELGQKTIILWRATSAGRRQTQLKELCASLHTSCHCISPQEGESNRSWREKQTGPSIFQRLS